MKYTNENLQYLKLTESLNLASGHAISSPHFAYETFGNLSKEKDNVILVLHGISADTHLCSTDNNPRKGWWEYLVGADKAIDLKTYFVICINYLGGCFGSVGPNSINPSTDQHYNNSFPDFNLYDMAISQKMVLDHLQIKKLAAIIAPSLGGIVAMMLTQIYKDITNKLILISTGIEDNINVKDIQLKILSNNDLLHDSIYEKAFFKLSYQYALLKYTHPDRFNSNISLTHYLNTKSNSFVNKFNPYTYIRFTNAIKQFNLKTLADICNQVLCDKIYIISVKQDLLYPLKSQHQFFNLISKHNYTYHEIIESRYGHDAFLFEKRQFSKIIKGFLNG